MSFCSKCGNHLNSDDVFCSKCGNAVSKQNENMPIKEPSAVANNEFDKSSGTMKPENPKNKGIKFLIVSLAIQILSILGCISGGTFGAIMAKIALLSFVLVFVSGILCIKYSKTSYKHKGKGLGIVFAILNGITIVILGCALLFSGGLSKQDMAIDCAKELKTMLKDPDSLMIRGDIITFHSDEQSTTYIIIPYSAANSYGGKVSNVAFFSESLGYLGDNDDNIDEMSGKRKEQYVDAKVFYGIGEVIGNWDNSNTVSGKSVAKAVDCDYSKY